MSIPIETFRNRFNEKKKKKGLLASDVAAKTGISKSTISKYIHGQIEAKQDKIYLIANAYNVDPAWLMGYDVPMIKLSPETLQTTYSSAVDWNNGQIQRLMTYALRLSKLHEHDREMIEGMIDRLAGGDSDEK